jgi:high-affinity K+ transport system ATPase subunit B
MLYFIIFFCWFCIFAFLVINASFKLVQKFYILVFARVSVNLFLDVLMVMTVKEAAVAEKEGKKTARVLMRFRHEVIDDDVDDQVRFFWKKI